MERDFSKIEKKYLDYLPTDFRKTRLDRLKKAILANQTVLNLIVQEHQHLFEYDKLPNGMIALKPMYIKPTDIIKMRSTLKSFLRDWAKEVSQQHIALSRYFNIALIYNNS